LQDAWSALSRLSVCPTPLRGRAILVFEAFNPHPFSFPYSLFSLLIIHSSSAACSLKCPVQISHNIERPNLLWSSRACLFFFGPSIRFVPFFFLLPARIKSRPACLFSPVVPFLRPGLGVDSFPSRGPISAISPPAGYVLQTPPTHSPAPRLSRSLPPAGLSRATLDPGSISNASRNPATE